MTRFRSLLIAAALVAGVAGCLSDASTSEADAGDAMTNGPQASAVNFSATDCRESGSVAVHPMPADPMLADGFERADVDEEMGSPMTGGGLRMLGEGPKWANWHMGMRCENHVVGDGADAGPLEMGWVGVLVKPPVWDTSGVQRHFFLTALSFSNEAVVEAIKAGAGGHVGKTDGVIIEWVPAPAEQLLHFYFSDLSHGTYESWTAMRSVGTREVAPTRFWIAAPVDHEPGDGDSHMSAEPTGYRPTALEFVTTPDPGFEKFLQREASTLFTHRDVNGEFVPGHYGPNGGGVLWDGFARTFSLSEADDVVLTDVYEH